MSQLSDYKDAVDRILQDKDRGDKLTDAQVNSFIDTDAVKIYSKHRPQNLAADISASNTYDYEINDTNLPSWIDKFSDIQDVEWPADESQKPNTIPREEWMIYKKPSTEYLRFLRTTPNSGTIRVWYTAPHTIGASSSTVPDNDFSPFCNLAASLCASAVARAYAENSDSTIGADAVVYREKSDIWATRAKELLKMYIDYIFPGDEELDGAFGQKEFDTIYGTLGLPRLTHPEWQR